MIKTMKVSTYNTTATWLLILLLGGWLNPIQAATPFGKKEFTKKIEKAFTISPDGMVDLNNRYGTVTVKTWDQNRVMVEVIIKVNSKSEDSAKETFDRIKIDISDSPNRVSVATQIEAASSSSWTSWFSSSSCNDDFTIDYNIQMPASNQLTLANKYGNSTVENLKGHATIDVKYGNIDMANVAGNLTFDLGYGNAIIGNTGDANVMIKYSNLKMKQAKAVQIDSKYSKIKIEGAGVIKSLSKYDTYDLGQIKSLRNDGKYDQIDIERVENLELITKYTNVEVDHLQQSADVTISHGGMTIRSLSAQFEQLRLEGKYTDFKITCSGAFQLDASTSYGGVDYPDGMEVLIDKQKSTAHEVQGYKGSKNSGRIKAHLEYGHLKVN
jgi:hypothetical protein